MDSDWEVEVGGGASVIEPDWPEFVDLRLHPEHICKIAEAAASAPLARLLLALNRIGSPLYTSKCDLWEPESAALACYVDLLPREDEVFKSIKQAEAFCRDAVARLNAREAGELGAKGQLITASFAESMESAINLVIRQAVTSTADGFGVTVYLSAKSASAAQAAKALSVAMTACTEALLSVRLPQNPIQR
ncbi:MAG: hypothetical protein WCF68_07825 [Terriglobales bacterium]